MQYLRSLLFTIFLFALAGLLIVQLPGHWMRGAAFAASLLLLLPAILAVPHRADVAEPDGPFARAPAAPAGPRGAQAALAQRESDDDPDDGCCDRPQDVATHNRAFDQIFRAET